MSKATRILRLASGQPDPNTLAEAAAVLRRGGTVAFPTETVYGLGADALQPEALAGIFAAKGRPLDNPLIVHIAGWEQAEALIAGEPPPLFWRLGRLFWPGPLTLVVPRHGRVPAAVSAGLPTVAIRWPAHPVAEALIKLAAVAVAAPSANLSGRPSPTTAEHVEVDLAGRIDLILDGGPTGVGIESTVLDLTRDPPLLLRPGGITREMLAEAVGEVAVAEAAGSGPVPSPGMKYRHYAPAAPLRLLAGDEAAVAAAALNELTGGRSAGLRIGLLASRQTLRAVAAGGGRPGWSFDLGDRRDLAAVAASLYRGLRQADAQDLDLILGECFPEAGLGAALMDRLRRAADMQDNG